MHPQEIVRVVPTSSKSRHAGTDRDTDFRSSTSMEEHLARADVLRTSPRACRGHPPTHGRCEADRCSASSRFAAVARDASAASRRERCSSIAATIRRCSFSGGTGNSMVARFFREIRFLVVPAWRAEISARNSGVLIHHMSQRGSTLSDPGRTMQTSTAVTQGRGSPGKRHARPSGSGMRAINTSPDARNVHPRRAADSEVRNRLERSRKNPSPMSASCVSRTSPSGS